MAKNTKTLLIIAVIIPTCIAIVLKMGKRYSMNNNTIEEVEDIDIYQNYDDIYRFNKIIYNKTTHVITTNDGDVISDSIDWLYYDSRSDIMPFSRGNTRGYIDTENCKILISPQYEHAWVFREGLAAVSLNDKLFFINKDNDVVIGGFEYVKYKDFFFENGVSMAGKDTLVGLIDKKGKWLIEPQFTYIKLDRNSGNLLAFSPKHTISEYSKDGKLINSSIIKEAYIYRFDNPKLLIYESEPGWFGLFDIEKGFITGPQFKDLIYKGDYIYYLSENNRWGIMNNNGQILTKDIFISIDDL